MSRFPTAVRTPSAEEWHGLEEVRAAARTLEEAIHRLRDTRYPLPTLADTPLDPGILESLLSEPTEGQPVKMASIAMPSVVGFTEIDFGFQRFENAVNALEQAVLWTEKAIFA